MIRKGCRGKWKKENEGKRWGFDWHCVLLRVNTNAKTAERDVAVKEVSLCCKGKQYSYFNKGSGLREMSKSKKVMRIH